MKKIAIILLAAVLLFPSGCPAFGSSSEDIKPVLMEAKNKLTEWLGTLDNDLKSTVRLLSKEDFNSKETRDLLGGLCIGRTYVIDAVIMDKSGKEIAIRTPGDRRLDEKDIRAQEDAVRVEVTGKPAMSAEFRSTTNKYMIVFEYPIFGADSGYRGSLSLLVDQKEYLAGIIKPIVRNVPCQIWMMQPDGDVVYAEYPELLDKNLFSDDIFRTSKSLHDFAKKAAAEKAGEGSYDYSPPGQGSGAAKRNGVWDTVGLYDSEWRVIAVDSAG